MSAFVYDGDTLRLQDGTNVRLIGINTPEMGRDGEPSEPLAEAGLTALEALAGPGTKLGLRVGQEQRDRYGRLLAHVFLGDGSNVQRALLETGLATALVVPPNLWVLPCYAEAEAIARKQRLGVWKLDTYRPTPAAGLDRGERGFRLVKGKVARIGESRGNWWLNLTREMAVRIPKRDLEHFHAYHPKDLLGREVEVRGWLQRRRGEFRITVRHPAALVLRD